MSKLINIQKKTLYKSHVPKILKRIKIDEKIPLSFPIAIAYKNTYASLSEKQRHLAMIEEVYKLRYLIALNPKNEFNILKEFLSKIGIQDPQYIQSNYLFKLSEFFNGDFSIDPNKTIQEIILSVLENHFIPINLSPSLMTQIIKENLYVSPYRTIKQDKKQCNQCFRKSQSQKNYELPQILTKSDPYHIITLSRQLKSNDIDSARYECKNYDILAKELEDEVSIYRKKSFLKTKLSTMIAREKDIRDIRIPTNNNDDNNKINEINSKDNKSLLYVTQNSLSRNSFLESSQRINELNKIEEGDTKRIVQESMKLIKEQKNSKKKNNSEEVIKRLYNPKIDRIFNEYDMFKKNKKLTEVIILERINRKLAINRLKQFIDVN